MYIAYIHVYAMTFQNAVLEEELRMLLILLKSV
jgi:hypothetical protein